MSLDWPLPLAKNPGWTRHCCCHGQLATVECGYHQLFTLLSLYIHKHCAVLIASFVCSLVRLSRWVQPQGYRPSASSFSSPSSYFITISDVTAVLSEVRLSVCLSVCLYVWVGRMVAPPDASKRDVTSRWMTSRWLRDSDTLPSNDRRRHHGRRQAPHQNDYLCG